ncbi:MAG: ATP-binding cassette domain-containing protein [Actinomycetota bacterium]|nr:ATP-binding cassette domain-containing protein [Actinomycetota bacterium]
MGPTSASASPSAAGGAEPRPGAEDAVVVTRGLTKTYPGGIEAVCDLDLEIHRGEVFGLLGPNGAGKSTTAGMLTTRVVPTAGRAEVAGADVVAEPARVKQIIGVVPQTNTLDRALDVRENLYWHGRYFGWSARAARRRSDELLARFRLERFANAPVLALSGGMAQRLMVARAVFHEPDILFLDEPTSGLDPQSRLALWELLREQHDAGRTILLTTHYMEEADALCDRVAIIDHGRLLALDTPARLKAGVSADTIVTVRSDGPPERLADALTGSVAGLDRAEVSGEDVRLSVRGADGVVPAVVAAADSAGLTITDLTSAPPTLETVFIELTGTELRER